MGGAGDVELTTDGSSPSPASDRTAGTVVDSSVGLDVFTDDAVVLARSPHGSRDPRRVATYIPGTSLIAPASTS